MQLSRYKVRRSKLNHIFISHLHGDHYFGLIGLLTSMNLLGREAPLHLYGPAPLKEIIDIQLKVADTIMKYPLQFHPNPKEGMIVDEEKFTVSCFPVQHRIDCWGYIFREKKAPRKLVKEKAIEYGVPSIFFQRLQWGDDYVNKNGETIKNEWVTQDATPGKSYAYCADTIFDELLAEVVKEVSLLYHESTYLHDLAERAADRFHSTAHQAASIAHKAQVKKLLIGHFSSKYDCLDDFLTEATAVFPNTDLALEGVTYLM